MSKKELIGKLTQALMLLRGGYIDAAYDVIEEVLRRVNNRK